MKEDVIEVEGTVTDLLAGGQYKVQLDNGHGALAYVSGKMKRNRIRVIVGDRVKLEMTPYDLTRGRISFRHKDERAPAGPGRRQPFRRR